MLYTISSRRWGNPISSYSDFIKLNKETRDRVVTYAYWYLRDKNNELAVLKVDPDIPRGRMHDYVTSCLPSYKKHLFYHLDILDDKPFF